MGTSDWQNISYCCELIYTIAPQRTLDVGMGSLGRWAVLVREFADVWHDRVVPSNWTCVVDGIEVYEPIIQRFHRDFYDHVYVGDAFVIMDELDHYDLVILGDVLEHFAPDTAFAMLRKCLRHARFVMVVVPLGGADTWAQESLYGNQWEKHRTFFRARDLSHSSEWYLVTRKLFKDYKGRRFGVFLLSAVSSKWSQPALGGW